MPRDPESDVRNAHLSAEERAYYEQLDARQYQAEDEELPPQFPVRGWYKGHPPLLCPAPRIMPVKQLRGLYHCPGCGRYCRMANDDGFWADAQCTADSALLVVGRALVFPFRWGSDYRPWGRPG